jgi:hypothetical protein
VNRISWTSQGVIVNKELHALLDQLTLEERTGEILKVRVSKGTPIPSRTPRALYDEVKLVSVIHAARSFPEIKF